MAAKKKAKRRDRLEDVYDDPKPPDEDDPEFKEEMFESFKYKGWKPEDLIDPKDRKEYGDWLKRHS